MSRGRLHAIRPFLAMEVLERARALEADGVRVLHLEIGEPDFRAPPAVLDACQRALVAGETRYTDSRGLPALRRAIAEDKGRRAGVPVSTERVIVTSGTSPALLLVFACLLEDGGEVVIPSPHYPCYPNFVHFCGGRPVFVPCHAADGFAVDPDAVRRALSPRTRAIVLGTPANPTGAVQSAETLAALAGLGVPLVCDEIYDGLVYEGASAASALAAPGEVYVLDGFSKRYAMTGFRLGYAVVPEPALRMLQILQQNLFISASEFVQHAGIAALREGEAHRVAMRDACARRRRLLLDGLARLGLRVEVPPAGAFYVLADARHVDPDSTRLATRLLETAHVAVTPGADFGEAAEGCLRFCYATSEAVIEEALERLAEALPALAA